MNIRELFRSKSTRLPWAEDGTGTQNFSVTVRRP